MTITNLTECKDPFDHIVKVGDIVLYHAEGRNPTVYKGKILEILQKDNLYHPSIILEITDVCSYDTGRIGTKSKKLQSTNIFALKE